MINIDLSKKNAAISIILTLDMIFFSVAIVLSLSPHTKELGDKVWSVFMGANGALFLLLNAEAKRDAGIVNGNGSNPTIQPVNPAQTQK